MTDKTLWRRWKHFTVGMRICCNARQSLIQTNDLCFWLKPGLQIRKNPLTSWRGFTTVTVSSIVSCLEDIKAQMKLCFFSQINRHKSEVISIDFESLNNTCETSPSALTVSVIFLPLHVDSVLLCQNLTSLTLSKLSSLITKCLLYMSTPPDFWFPLLRLSYARSALQRLLQSSPLLVLPPETFQVLANQIRASRHWWQKPRQCEQCNSSVYLEIVAVINFWLPRSFCVVELFTAARCFVTFTKSLSFSWVAVATHSY